MKLKSLKLTNFQGVGSFILDTNCKDCEIRGANAVGKTTIFSAFCFLLYGLDSTGDSFLPKSIDETGEAKHGVDSSVEAIFVNDKGQELILKKVFKEVWRRKHGSPKKIFTGHSTTHFWDFVSITEKEYKRRLAEIAPESVLKLLVNTRYFSETLHWQKRRELLLDICGDIQDKDIIKSNSKLARMPEILGSCSFDERKTMIKSEKTTLNKQLEEIPIRISEATKSQPDITGLSLPSIEKELSGISKALTQKNEEAARIESGGEIAEKVKKQREIESRLLEIENQINEAKNKAESEQRKQALKAETIQRKKVAGLETAKEDAQSSRDRTLKTIKNREVVNKVAEQEIATLRVVWNTVNESVFDELSMLCPTCGTNLEKYPTKKTQEIKEAFNVKKAKELARIDQSGREMVVEITERKNLNETDQADVSLYEEKIEELAEQISEVKAQTSKPEKETEKKKPFKNKEQEALELDLTEIKLSIEGLRANSDEAKEIVESEIAALTGRQEGINLNKQALETHKKGETRIAELGDQQRTVAEKYENLEADLYVMDLFIRVKVSMLEGKVNDKFKMAKFKMFEVQVNGQLNEICSVTYDGIPWDKGLNNSSQINIGLDIINTLSEHFGLTLPVFVDNAESIIKTIPCNSQLIKLIVSKDYPTLTVKIDE